MRSLPNRGSPHTQDSCQPNQKPSTMPNGNPSQAATEPSRGISTSPVSPHYACDYENGSSTGSPPLTNLSSSLETLDPSVDDHMNWSPPSPILSTPNTSDTSAASSDSDTPPPYTNSINLSDLLPLPTSSPGCLTHAHQLAMAHRVTYDKLLPGGAFDPALYTPLATLLGKVRFPHPHIQLSHHFPPRRLTQPTTGLPPRPPRPPNPCSSPIIHSPSRSRISIHPLLDSCTRLTLISHWPAAAGSRP
jgi:hypothetical protein